MLLLPETGIYDSKTVTAVREYQKNQGLKVDGICGEFTWDSLVAFVEEAGRGPEVFERKTLTTIELRGTRAVQAALGKDSTYTRVAMRDDIANLLLRPLEEEVFQLGGVITTAGAVRELTARVTAGRVPLSGHYLARDLDLGTYTLMRRPDQDPYIVERAPDLGPRRWRVWMKCPAGDLRELNAVVWGQSATTPISVAAVDFTALAAKHGFDGISCHKGSWWDEGGRLPRGGYSGVEAWHFSCRGDLEPGETTFGDELLRLYPLSKLKSTAPWENRHAVYREEWF